MVKPHLKKKERLSSSYFRFGVGNLPTHLVTVPTLCVLGHSELLSPRDRPLCDACRMPAKELGWGQDCQNQSLAYFLSDVTSLPERLCGIG